MLTLAETEDGPFVEAPWADKLYDLGSQAFKFSSDPRRLSSGEQLFIAISVPVRHLAASLIAAGWMTSAPVSNASTDCFSALMAMRPGSLVRMVTDHYVILDKYLGLDGDRLSLGGKFQIGSALAVKQIHEDVGHAHMRMAAPAVPSFGRPRAKSTIEWAQFLCSPPEGLAIIGARSTVLEDLSAWASAEGTTGSPVRLRDLVLPRVANVATWATEIISPRNLADGNEEIRSFEAVIFDGATAIKSAELVYAPLAIAVIDRSVMDDSAAEFVTQRRNRGSEPLLPDVDLGWRPPSGVEVVAFRSQR